MKIAKHKVDPHIVVEADQVTVSISHQVRIDGQDCWVKYEVVHHVFEEETLLINEEIEDLIDHVSTKVIKVAEQAAAKVMERN